MWRVFWKWGCVVQILDARLKAQRPKWVTLPSWSSFFAPPPRREPWACAVSTLMNAPFLSACLKEEYCSCHIFSVHTRHSNHWTPVRNSSTSWTITRRSSDFSNVKTATNARPVWRNFPPNRARKYISSCNWSRTEYGTVRSPRGFSSCQHCTDVLRWKSRLRFLRGSSFTVFLVCRQCGGSSFKRTSMLKVMLPLRNQTDFKTICKENYQRLGFAFFVLKSIEIFWFLSGKKRTIITTRTTFATRWGKKVGEQLMTCNCCQCQNN